jgi:hypothetical protein
MDISWVLHKSAFQQKNGFPAQFTTLAVPGYTVRFIWQHQSTGTKSFALLLFTMACMRDLMRIIFPRPYKRGIDLWYNDCARVIRRSYIYGTVQTSSYGTSWFLTLDTPWTPYCMNLYFFGSLLLTSLACSNSTYGPTSDYITYWFLTLDTPWTPYCMNLYFFGSQLLTSLACSNSTYGPTSDYCNYCFQILDGSEYWILIFWFWMLPNFGLAGRTSLYHLQTSVFTDVLYHTSPKNLYILENCVYLCC